MDNIVYELKKIPPVTRFILIGIITVTLSGILGIVSPYRFIFYWPFIQKFQLWRLVTNFMIGSRGIGLLFDLFLLYRHASDIEISHFRNRTSDCAYAFTIIGATIIAITRPFKSSVMFRHMIMAIIYLWSQVNPSAQVSLFGFITLSSFWFPFALVAIDVLNYGPVGAIDDLAGILAAHLYWYLTELYPRSHGGRNLPALATPRFVQRLLGNGPADPTGTGNVQPAMAGTGYRVGGGTAFAPVRPRVNQSSNQSTTQTINTPNSGSSTGYRWGSGQRLGAE